MAIKKNQQKAKKNWSWEVREEGDTSKNTRTTRSTSKNKTTSKKQQQKEIKNTFKFFGVKGIVVLLLIIVVFAGIGVGTGFVLTRNDCFEIIGQDEIELQASEKYFDQGVKVVEFGKNCQDKVSIETDMKTNADGSFSPQVDEDNNPILKTYYIIYKVNTFKLSKLVFFVENSEEIVVD